MVILNVKKGDKSLFLYETTTQSKIFDLRSTLVEFHNDIHRIERICYEIEELAKYGVVFPPKMQGLSSDQIQELNLKDEWAEKHVVSVEYVSNVDPQGRRNGRAPTEKYADILTRTTAEAKARISQKMVNSNVCLTCDQIQDTFDILNGAIKIAYPMGLPAYEPVHMELSRTIDLTGTQAGKDVLDESNTDLWWANKLLDINKVLSDYIGKNEKSKLIVKLHKKGHGPPAKEPALTEDQKKDLMLAEYRRREELKKLEEDEDDAHLDSEWADNYHLKKTFMGIKNIKFK